MHIEFRRVFNRVPFISIRKGEIEVGYGKHAVTIGKYPDGDGFFLCWM